MIVGVGIDITEVPRIAALIQRWGQRFLGKLYTEGELSYSLARANSAAHLAARFAAKEATLKAMSVPSGLSWHEMEVVGGSNQPPRLELSGRAQQAARALGIARFHLSLTHTADAAAAFVIAESAD